MVARGRIVWRRVEPRRPRAFLASLALVGLVHGVLLAWSWSVLPWIPAALSVSFGPWFLAPFLVTATWLTGWLLRHRIVESSVTGLIGLACLATLLGAWIGASALFLLGTLMAAGVGSYEVLFLVPFVWIPGLVYGALGTFWLAPVAVPLAWLALQVLRAAAGGRLAL